MSAMRCSKCEKMIDTDTFDYDFKNDVCEDCIVHYCEDCESCVITENGIEFARCKKSKEYLSKPEMRVRRVSGNDMAYCSCCRDDNTCENFEEK